MEPLMIMVILMSSLKKALLVVWRNLNGNGGNPILKNQNYLN